MKRLEGKSAVITGAASGIGRATSLLFAEHGAKLIVVDRSPDVQATADAINKAGGRAVARVADVSKEVEVEAFIQAAVMSIACVTSSSPWLEASLPLSAATSFSSALT